MENAAERFSKLRASSFPDSLTEQFAKFSPNHPGEPEPVETLSVGGRVHAYFFFFLFLLLW